MTDKAAAVLAMSMLALTGCSSTPTQFYTLLSPAASQSAVTASFEIEVLPVDLPAQVATPQMVVRTGSGEMVPVDTRRWIAPLADEIRGALSADLTQKLGARDVYGLPGGAGSKGQGAATYRISVKVQRFESALGNYARIDAVWSVRQMDDNGIPAACSSSVSKAVQPGYEALADGHQRALAELADRIAVKIISAQQGRAVSCPAI